MKSILLNSTNNKFNSESDKKNINDASCINSFKDFNSVLFMSDFIENEENQSSEIYENKKNLSSNSNKENISNNINDIRTRSPSLEKCITNELLESITNEPNNSNQEDNFYINNNDIDNSLKITKKLFNNHNKLSIEKDRDNKRKMNDKSKKMKWQKVKKEKTLYEEIINGFQYQLKFIENSVHNILPKSYKNVNSNSNKNSNQIGNIFPPSNKKENLDNSNNYFSSNEALIQNINNNSYNISDYYNNKEWNEKQNDHQIHKLKKINEYYGDWICSNCFCLNRGYRKVCANCSYYRI